MPIRKPTDKAPLPTVPESEKKSQAARSRAPRKTKVPTISVQAYKENNIVMDLRFTALELQLKDLVSMMQKTDAAMMLKAYKIIAAKSLGLLIQLSEWQRFGPNDATGKRMRGLIREIQALP